MPEISVIIPTYNRSELLCEAVESILKQDFTDYEIIIVDDGSTDETKKTVDRYAKHLARVPINQDSGTPPYLSSRGSTTGSRMISYISGLDPAVKPRDDTACHFEIPNNKIRYIYQPKSGVSNARNTGIKAAAGNFIAFLDSDDLWEPKKLSSQRDFFIKHPDAYICYTKEKWLRNNSWVKPPQIYQPLNSQIIPGLLNRCFIGASSVMMRNELFDLTGYFDESMPVCEDLDLWLRIAIRYPIYLIDEPLTIKRMGQWPQLSTTTWGMDRYRIYALEKLLRTNNLNSRQKQLFLSAIHKKANILAKGSLKHNHPGLALKYGWKWLKSINIQK